MRVSIQIAAIALIMVLLLCQISHTQQKQTSPAEPLAVCIVSLEHADAEYLAAVLDPFLSPQGSITAHAPTNTLIIKDRVSVVDMLAEVIKGRPCTPVEQPPRGGQESGLEHE